MKWIEVNIARSLDTTKDEYLTKLVRPVLSKFATKIVSWHFLWEGKPWTSTLRLRFFADEKEIEQLQQFLEEKLKDIQHCYGAHGECGKEYKGEANTWGTKGWERGVMFLQFGADFALELVENRDKLGKSNEYKKNAFSYADRYTHLFLNQISSLVDEPDFFLKEGIFRFACQIRKRLSQDKITSIIEEAKQKIQSDC